jgi:CheY-like chemotaxis protein
MMPTVNGFDAAATLRNDVRARGIPIIVLTAKDLTEEDWAYLDERVQGLQIKGSTPSRKLVEEIQRVTTSGNVGKR